MKATKKASIRKHLLLTLLVGLLCVVNITVVYASDYIISNASWEDDNGAIKAVWDNCDNAGSFKLTLYKLETSDKNKVITVSTSNTSYNFTNSIISRGIGKYIYTIYPTKGGEGYTVFSDELDVTVDMLYDAKNYRKTGESKSNTGVTPYPLVNKWENNGETWKYRYYDGTYASNKWENIDGYWYYFNSVGIMQTGWTAIDRKWYYFEPTGTSTMPKGACYQATVTPDGYQVNGNGEWIIDGVIQTANDSMTSNSVGTAKVTGNSINALNIVVRIYTGSNGAAKKADISSVTNSKITSFSYNIPYENWSPGTPVLMTATLIPQDGYLYSSSMKVTCTNAKVIEQSGNASNRTVVLQYTPNVQLEIPRDLSMDSNYSLSWSPVKYASYYRVKVNAKYSSLKTYTVKGTSINIKEYCQGKESRCTVEVTAHGKDGESCYIASNAAKIENLEQYLNKNATGNTLVQVGSNLMYKDRNGKSITGWQKIINSWYYFDANGCAASGLFTDSDGNTYYFSSSDHKMQTGYVYINGNRVFFNDGSVEGVPYGAKTSR